MYIGSNLLGQKFLPNRLKDLTFWNPFYDLGIILIGNNLEINAQMLQ